MIMLDCLASVLGFGLYFYLKNKVGPLFWAIIAGIGVVLAWLAHFSPFSAQTPQSIYHAYATPAGGAVAVSVLALLMLALVATTVYLQKKPAPLGNEVLSICQLARGLPTSVSSAVQRSAGIRVYAHDR